MPLPTHGDLKYDASSLVDGAADWDTMRIEHRRVGSGAMNPLTSECTELVYILSGNARVRRKGDGQLQEGMAVPGTSWLVPARTHETLLELDGSTECLHIFLPDTLIERSALADYEIDPARTKLTYAGGFLDPVLGQIAGMLRSVLVLEHGPAGRMFVEGVRIALAARLIDQYRQDGTSRAPRPSSLDARRLRKVLDFIEARFGDDLSLDDLARQACLSPFHFTRLFADATGLSPHRFLTRHRVEAAKSRLMRDQASLVEIALDTGFGSQANFTRVFRKATGMTPGVYRELHRR